jgi:hypothetical protein
MLHGFCRCIHARHSGKQSHGQVRIQGMYLLKKLQTRHPGHVHITDDNIDISRSDPLQRATGRCTGFNRKWARLQCPFETPEHQRVVVDEKDASRRFVMFRNSLCAIHNCHQVINRIARLGSSCNRSLRFRVVVNAMLHRARRYWQSLQYGDVTSQSLSVRVHQVQSISNVVLSRQSAASIFKVTVGDTSSPQR